MHVTPEVAAGLYGEVRTLVDPSAELYRRFTPRKAARIQSFPERFIFAGSESDAYRQTGQAIPPVLMWHLARSLYEQVLS